MRRVEDQPPPVSYTLSHSLPHSLAHTPTHPFGSKPLAFESSASFTKPDFAIFPCFFMHSLRTNTTINRREPLSWLTGSPRWRFRAACCDLFSPHFLTACGTDTAWTTLMDFILGGTGGLGSVVGHVDAFKPV